IGAVPAAIAVATVQEGLAAVPDPDSELAGLLHAVAIGKLRILGRSDDAKMYLRRLGEIEQRVGSARLELALAQAEFFDATQYTFDFDAALAAEQRVDQLDRQTAG